MKTVITIFGALSAFVAYEYAAEMTNRKREVVGQKPKAKIPKFTKLFNNNGQTEGEPVRVN